MPGWVPGGRALHLVDVENLAGGPFATHDRLADVRRRYQSIALLGEADHVVAGCNPRLVHDAAAIWLSTRWVTRRGKDGAEAALIEAVDPDDVVRRFHRVVIGSGDHAFTRLASRLRTRGVHVWVIGRPRSIARSLAREADVVGLLHGTVPHPTTAGVGDAA